MRLLVGTAVLALAGCSVIPSGQSASTTSSTVLRWGHIEESALPAFPPPPLGKAIRATSAAPAQPVWDVIQHCECPSGWHCNTGNGYYGGLQMTLSFWRSYGGLEFAERPDLASREQQITVAERARSKRGFSPWPTCGRRV